jgi:hypothetical protein
MNRLPNYVWKFVDSSKKKGLRDNQNLCSLLNQNNHSVSPCFALENKQKQAVRSRRFDRVTIGFWTGAVFLGMAGCVLGICMPYHRPAAIVISALWWSIYLGCFGGGIGALIALFTKRASAPASRWSVG